MYDSSIFKVVEQSFAAKIALNGSSTKSHYSIFFGCVPLFNRNIEFCGAFTAMEELVCMKCRSFDLWSMIQDGSIDEIIVQLAMLTDLYSSGTSCNVWLDGFEHQYATSLALALDSAIWMMDHVRIIRRKELANLNLLLDSDLSDIEIKEYQTALARYFLYETGGIDAFRKHCAETLDSNLRLLKSN